MKIFFDITDNDSERAKAFFESRRSSEFVQERQRRNVEGRRDDVRREAFWKAKVDCLLTTQQRSGPDSPIARFVRSEPFPLGLEAFRNAGATGAHATEMLTNAGGIRRTSIIGQQLQQNLRWLDADAGWLAVERIVAMLEEEHAAAAERVAAESLAEHLAGIGPKQSRNVLQVLGLTKYETPIDSRVVKWLTEFGFPLKLSAVALSDHAVYGLVSDGFQALCASAGVLPCVMDAAIFSSFDRAWTKDELVW